jgi:integrase
VSKWVFPSTGTTGHLKSPFKFWKRLRERAGAPDLRIHDIRRTVGSYLASQGQNSFIIAKTLGHKSLDATKVYARMNLDPVREALEKVKELAQLKPATEATASSNVVKIAGKSKRKK